MTLEKLDPGDNRTWTHSGKECKIVKDTTGHWCGYSKTSLRGFTAVDLNYFAGDHNFRLLEVHGGISYGPDEDGWIGFDCAHARDLCLDESAEPWGPTIEVYDRMPVPVRQHGSIDACIESDDCRVWRIADVKEEVERLAEQIILLESFVQSVDS